MSRKFLRLYEACKVILLSSLSQVKAKQLELNKTWLNNILTTFRMQETFYMRPSFLICLSTNKHLNGTQRMSCLWVLLALMHESDVKVADSQSSTKS
jgi:hypothetical protein